MTLRTYYLLTKPGIIFGNLLTTVGGFALASRGHIDLPLFLATFVGIGLVIASACVFNNYIDRDLDKKMARTKNRALAKGLVSIPKALSLAVLLGLVGLAVLARFTNPVAVSIALLGFLIYVLLYSFWKSRTQYATLVGSISGALPPVIGYTAVSHTLDPGALILFLILVLWQMPHFYAIAMYRSDEYAAALVPVLPVIKGVHVTKVHMLLYVIAFLISLLMLIAFGYTGYAYLAVAAPLGIWWLWLTIQGFQSDNDRLWARKMFRLSLVIITALCIMISVDTL